MRRIIFLFLAIASLVIVTDNSASARNGCGVGRHYSHYRGFCVWNGGTGYYGAYRPAYDYYAAPRVVDTAPVYYGYPARATYDYYYAPRSVYFAPPVQYGSPYGYYSRPVYYAPRSRYFDIWY